MNYRIVCTIFLLAFLPHPNLIQAQKEPYFPDQTHPEFEQIEGHKAFFLISDHAPPSHRPWVWFAPVLLSVDDQPPNKDIQWTFSKLLEHGISIAGIDVGESYGSPRGSKLYSEFYKTVVAGRRLSKKPCLLAQSRGGLMLYNWAIANPSSVACVAGIYPVVNIKTWPLNLKESQQKKWLLMALGSREFRSAANEYELSVDEFLKRLPDFNPIEHLQPLAAEHVPIFSIHGNEDATVPYAANSEALTNVYRSLGGEAKLVPVEKKGHVRYDTDFFQSVPLVEWLVANIETK